MTGVQHMMVMSEEQDELEYDDIRIRFRTLEPNGLLLALRDDFSNERKRDSLEVALSRGGILVSVSVAGVSTVWIVKYISEYKMKIFQAMRQ